ncbi:flgD [Wigglesworthia glossinidia endosymbiont of Glossina brevipalpis]|uniref:Basal-body rod modification protein FlgD n=1 Tax=Wigglesworthia glossinidia brevipalpis TaxID=36870 RepID=Q8D3G1_WIGBR|nr:flgD [Wigglesworthia glossinidia endosymbiont of Glossina brevipalpis]
MKIPISDISKEKDTINLNNHINQINLKKRNIFQEKFFIDNTDDIKKYSNELENKKNEKFFEENIEKKNIFKEINNSNNLQSLTDNFLKMILVQIKNQDPTHPIDNNHLTTQMTQMHTALGIEKLNKSIQEIKQTMNNSQYINLSNWIGKTVMIEGNPIISFNGNTNYGFQLSTKSDNVFLTLTDLEGNIYKEQFKNLKSGVYKLNIKNANTNPAINENFPESRKTFKVNFEAINNDGNRPDIRSLKSETINNVIFKNGSSKLSLGRGKLIDFTEVISIE